MIKDKDQSWTSFIIEAVILIGIVLFIRFYIFQFFRVSGPSMCPTLNVLQEECQYGKGEFIFVNEISYNFFREPARGEVVVFHPPHKKIFYIKRILGVPGDTIEIKNGKTYLNNEFLDDYEIDESYLSPRNEGRTQTYGRDSFTVPEGYFLLFGDNRAESLDARQCFYSGGCDGTHTPFIPKKNITGKAEFVIWPFWKSRWIKNELAPLLELELEPAE